MDNNVATAPTDTPEVPPQHYTGLRGLKDISPLEIGTAAAATIGAGLLARKAWRGASGARQVTSDIARGAYAWSPSLDNFFNSINLREAGAKARAWDENLARSAITAIAKKPSVATYLTGKAAAVFGDKPVQVGNKTLSQQAVIDALNRTTNMRLASAQQLERRILEGRGLHPTDVAYISEGLDKLSGVDPGAYWAGLQFMHHIGDRVGVAGAPLPTEARNQLLGFFLDALHGADR